MSFLDSYKKFIQKKFDINKPAADTFDGWEIWHENAKKNYPVKYWLLETFPDFINDCYRFVTKPFSETKYWIRYRIFDRQHVIKTGLKPNYYDFDTRCIHGMFNMLIEFVENDIAWHSAIFYEHKMEKYPWYSKGLFRFKSVPKPEFGVAHLKWESTLDSASLPITERSDYQAEKARELLDLYHWWKYIRPQRIDPMILSGWSALVDEREALGDGLSGLNYLSNRNKTPEQKKREREAIDRTNKIEAAYDDEDTQQLIRLIKLRKSMWT
jgi:hypothetical protein